IYVPILPFYPNNNCEEVNNLVAERSKLLKTSLSETLTHFYPFAGKFQYNDSICCNDQGAAFLETHVNCPISKILEKPDFVMLKQLLPADMESRQEGASYLVQVQANFFG
ncbi:PREDICTED: vinorine synthase, partial [Prunus dulcis]